MASSESKTKTKNDVGPADEETLDFDENTLKGEDSCFPLTRSRRYTEKLFCVNLHSWKITELSALMKIQQTPSFCKPYPLFS